MDHTDTIEEVYWNNIPQYNNFFFHTHFLGKFLKLQLHNIN